MRKITVAGIQMEIEPANIQANLEKAEKMLLEVFREKRCDLVVFPEYCITGPIPFDLDLALNSHSKAIKSFQALAKKFKTYLVCGSFIKKIGGEYFNTSILIDPKGEIILEYHKNHLWLPERKYLTSGSALNIVKTPIGNISIILCWDLMFPDICNKLAAKGADIICCPSYWTKEDDEELIKKYGFDVEKTMVDTICPARAIENEVLLIYVNGAGEAKVPLQTTVWQSNQIGQTQICVPVKGVVKRIADNHEGYITYVYDRKMEEDAEKSYRIRADLKKAKA